MLAIQLQPQTILRYYRSTDSTINSSDTQVGGIDGVSGLAASATGNETINITAPTTHGTYYYYACVVAVPLAGETTTSNNCSTGVAVTVGRPDLTISSFTLGDTTLTPGQNVSLNATVRNSGNLASGLTTLRYYRSIDSTIDSSDTQVGTDTVSGLAASATGNETINITAPTTNGTYYYYACVAAVTSAGETNTSNNCTTGVAVTVGRPDLTISAFSVNNTTANPGQNIVLNATVRNSGSLASAEATLRYYRSTNSIISTGDIQLTTDPESSPVSSLAVGATSNENATITVPTAHGTYYYGVCVVNVSYETATGNNCSTAVTVTVHQFFTTLSAATNTQPDGIWSDGTTMWVADRDDDKIYAYNLATKARDSSKDFNTLIAAGNIDPINIWSDGTTMWVGDLDDNKLYAYNLATKLHDSDKDFNTLNAAGNTSPYGMWSDGTTMWVADFNANKIYAYNVATKARDISKDFNTLIAAGNTDAVGIWSDGTTMWVADYSDDKLFAYNLATKAYNSSKRL